MPQKKRKQNVAKGAKTSVTPTFQRSGVAGVGIPYHAELDPLKVLCQEDPNLEWLRKERALIAISYARGLEMWLVKARNAAFENRDLANTCGFMTLLCETEKEARYYNEVTQSLFHCVPHSLEDGLDFKDEIQCNTIVPNPDMNGSCEEDRESMELQLEDTPKTRKKLKRGFSFTKMFSRLRRSVSRRGGLNSHHMSTSRSRDAMLLETDTGGLEISSHQASTKTSLSRSENCLNRFGLDTTLSQDTKQTVDDTVLLSPGYCRSPIQFSFSEIWPIQEEGDTERMSDQLCNIEVAVEVNKTPLNLESTGSNKYGGESLKMQSAGGNLTHQNSGLEFVENDFKTVDMMTFEIPNSPKTQVELHVLLQTCSTDSDHEFRDFLVGGDKWEGFEPRERTGSSNCSFSEADADCDPPLINKQKNPFLPHYSVYL